MIYLFGLNIVEDRSYVFKKFAFRYSRYVMVVNINNGKCYEMFWELGEGSRVISIGEI